MFGLDFMHCFCWCYLSFLLFSLNIFKNTKRNIAFAFRYNDGIERLQNHKISKDMSFAEQLGIQEIAIYGGWQCSTDLDSRFNPQNKLRWSSLFGFKIQDSRRTNFLDPASFFWILNLESGPLGFKKFFWILKLASDVVWEGWDCSKFPKNAFVWPPKNALSFEV